MASRNVGLFALLGARILRGGGIYEHLDFMPNDGLCGAGEAAEATACPFEGVAIFNE